MGRQTFYDPLSPTDAWFLYAERPETPLDIGTVFIFEEAASVPGRRGLGELEERIAARLSMVPRYRQKIHRARFQVGHPVWVDDPYFDLGYHVRHEYLPPPGDGATFRATVARILQRPLDMRRPLWDMTVVHGIRGGRIALVNRAHHAMVDGVSSADILTVLMDLTPEGDGSVAPPEPWVARPAPSTLKLMVPLIRSRFRRGAGSHSFRRRWAFWRFPYGGMLSLITNMYRPAPDLFFNRKLGLQRTGRGVKVPLAQFKALKESAGGTVNDVVLGVVAEAMHGWLVERGERLPNSVKVFCPVSVREEDEHGALGNKVSGMVFDLPLADMTFPERVQRISRTTGDLKRNRQAVAAQRLAALGGWAPARLMVLAGRVMPNQQGGANINVTNVPGPQFPLYCGGAQLLETWPFAPLYPHMGLGIAVVSYNGDVYFGISADGGVVPDADAFARHLDRAARAATRPAA